MIKIKNIFVAYDGSPHAMKALRMVKGIAQLDPGIHIDIVHVAEMPLVDIPDARLITDLMNNSIEAGEKVLQEAENLMSDYEDRMKTILLKSGPPAGAMLDMIEKGDYDLVVVGTRGVSGIRGVFGSVSYKILSHSKVPVLTVEYDA